MGGVGKEMFRCSDFHNGAFIHENNAIGYFRKSTILIGSCLLGVNYVLTL